MRDNWRNALLGPSATIKDAVEVLTKSSMRIVLVTDKNNGLIGTVTDGDIRRGLIRGLSMETCIDSIIETNPVTVSSVDDRQEIIRIMRIGDLLQVPVVNPDGTVVGLEILQDLIYGEKKDNPVLLMAGGFGKRLYPLTRDLPKPLLNVGRKPILESIVEQITEAGFHRFYLAVHYKAELVREYFGDGSAWGVSITYLEESEPLGTGGALGLMPQTDLNLPILVVNGDLRTKFDFSELLRFHEAQGGIATVCVRDYEYEVPFGVVEVRESKIESIIEKPIQRSFINAGIYVLDATIARELEKNKSIDMPELLTNCITQGRQVNALPIHEYWLDIGRNRDYQRALVDNTD